MFDQPRGRRWVSGLLALAFLAYTTPVVSQDPSAFTIGLIPEMNVFEQMERFRPLAEYLSQRLGMPVELTMLSRYGNIVERMENKDVDAAFLGSFTGALASAQLGMIPIVRPINLDGSSTYWGYIFVRKDGGIETAEQMKGLRLALVERATTAGFVFPVAYFHGEGIDIDDGFFGDVQFWGSHDAAINAVLEGQADVGAAKNTIWEHLMRVDPRVGEELRILATSAKVPSNGLLVAPDVTPELRDRIRDLLLDLEGSPGASEILQRLRFKGFVPTSRESYQPVFDLATEAGIDVTSYTYRNE